MSPTLPSGHWINSVVVKTEFTFQGTGIWQEKDEIDSKDHIKLIKTERMECRIKPEVKTEPALFVFQPKKEEESEMTWMVSTKEEMPVSKVKVDASLVTFAADLEREDNGLHPQAVGTGAGVTPSPPPRQTRTRFFMEAVVITRRPPFSALGQSTSPHRTVVTSGAPNIKCKEKPPQIETVDQAMDDLKDDYRGIEFNRNTTSTRCPTSVPVPGPRCEQGPAFSRDFISTIYGGNALQIRPDTRDMTRPENFLYVNLKVHHLGPRVAGAPGSYFSVTMTENSQDTSLSGLQWVVFSGLAPNNWGYMGLYEMKLGQSMTKDEWLTLPGEVRDYWAKEIFKDPSRRGRIAWRKRLGRELADEEVVAGDGRYRAVTIEDVSDAFINGNETLKVLTMKCVGYDADIQRNLIEGVKTWFPPPPKTSRTTNTGKKAYRSAHSTKVKGKRMV